MDWSAAGIFLVATRAVHFAATVITVGSIIFQTVVAKRVLRSEEVVAASYRNRMLRIMWVGLAVALISGVIWLLLQAASMSGMPFNEALTADVLSTVIEETQFGEITVVRLGLAIWLAACLVYDRIPIAQWLGLVAAVGLAASLAWTGHGGSTLGEMGYFHLAADALHLIAAAAWIGGLFSLVSLLAEIERSQVASLAGEAALKFSILGMVSVATLLVSGLVNSVILVGSLRGLLVTAYGQLLLFKVTLFAAMLAFAAVNRFSLTPRLAAFSSNPSQADQLRQLARNASIEIVLGVAVLIVVAVLGTIHPAIHLAAD